MKSKMELNIVFGVLFTFGIVFMGTTDILDKAYAQTNSTINQGQTNSTINQGQTNSTINQTSLPTSTPSTATPAQKEASQSIRGVITETGEFLGNVTQKIITSKSAGTILNETSDVLGDAYVETKKFFSPN